MATFTLYHSKPEAFRDAICGDPITFDKYDLVATIDAPELGAVFQYTNHGVPGQVDNWTDGEPVKKLFAPKDRTRSTSVGDLIVDEFGQGFRVAGVGFEPVTVPLSASKA